MWRSLKTKARKAEYFFKSKDPVQKVVLEASKDSNDPVPEQDKVMIAKLSFNSTCLYSIQKTLWKRFRRIKKYPIACAKALKILDFCVKYGSPDCRDMTLRGMSELMNISTFTLKPKSALDRVAVEQSHQLAQTILDTVQNDQAYDEARRGDYRTTARVEGFKISRSLINSTEIARMQRRKELRASQERLGTDAYTTDEVFTRDKAAPAPQPEEEDSSSDSYELDIDPRSLSSSIGSQEHLNAFPGMPSPAPRQTPQTRQKSMSIMGTNFFTAAVQPSQAPLSARQSMPIQQRFVDDLITF